MHPHEITPVRQFRDDKLCGHCCVAMAADVKLWQAIEVIGHRRGTSGAQLVRALAAFGVKAKTRLIECDNVKPAPGSMLPEYAILAVKCRADKKWGGHWVLKWGPDIIDPSYWPDGKWRPVPPPQPYFSMAVELV